LILFFLSKSPLKAQYIGSYSSTSDSLITKDGQSIFIPDLQKENVPLTLVRGKVLTDDGSIPPKTQIRIFTLGSSEELKYVYNPNPSDGTYLFILPPGQNYTMMVESEGYETYTKLIKVPTQTQYYQLQQTVYLHKDKTLRKTIGVEDYFTNTEIKNTDSISKEDLLVRFIEKIISSSDTQTLKHLDQYLQNDIQGDTKYFSSLSHVIEKVIANSDLIMLQNLEKITRSVDPKEADLILYFSSNDAVLSQEHISLLKTYLTSISEDAMLDISAHSDVLGSTLSKYLISSLRAKSVTDFIDTTYPHLTSHYTVNIKSDSEPIEGQSLEKNRRVEIRVIR
jgi:outer membrane protein OmpA-like peptidoglycan-associated protein